MSGGMFERQALQVSFVHIVTALIDVRLEEIEVQVWMNERMNCITYIPPMKPEGQAQGCILRRSMAINPLGDDSPIRM